MDAQIDDSFLVAGGQSPLDLLSTSPTGLVASGICIYAAPYFAYRIQGKSWGIVQGCCNHWDCPRCGQLRAKKEYGRIVNGCTELAKDHDLYFLTITCRGKDLSHEDAEKGYLSWTNRLLDACRAKCKRAGGAWVYVQVTERQRRGHPHSHILTTFDVGDLCEGFVEKWRTDNAGNIVCDRKDALRSSWLAGQVVKSGLGEQYDISRVESAAAASRYVAKYMFKQSMFTADWPKRWKRVRYSQSFPKLPKLDTEAIALTDWQDWQKLALLAAVVVVKGDADVLEVSSRLRGTDVVLVNKTDGSKVVF